MLSPPAILALALQCAPSVAPSTMATLVESESSGNPYAIGVVGMQLVSQPKTLDEAITVAKSLLARGENISVGLGQLNKINFAGLGLTLEKAFEPCANLAGSAKILGTCYARYADQMGEGQKALAAGFSCYYSNNGTRGYQKEGPNQSSYVMKIAMNSEKLKGVPAIEFKPEDIKEVDAPQKNATQNTASVKAMEDGTPTKPDQEQAKPTFESWDVLGDFQQQ